jgi:NDP-mannose synthase
MLAVTSFEKSDQMPREALILAGGQGQRLLPYTMVLPKPLMPIGGMPILEIILRQLKAQGFRRVVLAVNHFHRLISTYFGSGERLGLDIAYNIEDEPLGTCGPISMCIDSLADDFVVMNGDVLTALNFRKMLDDHRAKSSDLTVAARNEEISIDFGVIDWMADGRVRGVREKPKLVHSINLGIYVLRKESVRSYVTSRRFLNMTDVIEFMVSDGKAVDGFMSTDAWIDIGRIAEYQRAQELFEQNRDLFLGPDDQIDSDVFILPQ